MAPDGARPDTQRIVITGLGVVSPVGLGKQAFWSALNGGHSGIGPVTLFDTSHSRSHLAAEIAGFDPGAILGTSGLRLLDRTTRLALCASQLALADAGLESNRPDAGSVGVALGSTLGSLTSRAGFAEQVLREGFRAVNPALFPNTVISSPASQIAIRFGVRGFAATISSGFTSSLVAMAYAAEMLRNGRATVALAGGVEELSARAFQGFEALGLLSRASGGEPEHAAPFDRGRNGAVLGEGAVALVMEPLLAARARGAVCLAEYLGGAGGSDRRAYQRYPRTETRAARVFEEALAIAGSQASAIDCVASGASGSPDGDLLEARALASVFAGRGRQPAAFAVKSMLGESFSAGGAMQAAAAIGVLATGVVPPTPSLSDPDPRCVVDCASRPREQRVTEALVTTVSPLGNSAACVLRAMNE